jgi:hypothetical protein
MAHNQNHHFHTLSKARDLGKKGRVRLTDLPTPYLNKRLEDGDRRVGLALKTHLGIERVPQSKNMGNRTVRAPRHHYPYLFIGFNDAHAISSNGWETSTRRNPETREGITAS